MSNSGEKRKKVEPGGRESEGGSCYHAGKLRKKFSLYFSNAIFLLLVPYSTMMNGCIGRNLRPSMPSGSG